MATPDRGTNVFLNCPFDRRFQPLFDACVFAISYCGYTVRSALEISDSGDFRLAKIIRLIEQSRFSIHDISRVELDVDSGLPRFNMPIELGIALGMKHLGRSSLRNHSLLVLDAERYRYQTFASDLAGVDIAAHQGRSETAIEVIRNFFAGHTRSHLPSPSAIVEVYRAFQIALSGIVASEKQKVEELTFVDRMRHITAFIESAAP